MDLNFQIFPHIVDVCPCCGKEHTYMLKATIEELKSPLFGGPGDNTEIALDCLSNEEQTFIHSINNPTNGEIIGVANKEELKSQIVKRGEDLQKDTNLSKSEFIEWIKQSREKALGFCDTMLKNSVGAIGVYFAIQKYIGIEKIDNVFQNFTILPPIFYLIASIIFILAQKPQYKEISESAFKKYKEKRLKRMNVLIQIGTFIFMLSTFLAILIFSNQLK